MSDDSYVILGVPRDATAQEIKRVYRELAKQWRPDRHLTRTPQERAEAAQQFGRIQAAYEALGKGEAPHAQRLRDVPEPPPQARPHERPTKRHAATRCPTRSTLWQLKELGTCRRQSGDAMSR
ncbi:DnaJ domain-containing protein [Nocardioides palaemonis]|uniref:DnaJ domain-containing protein n=1 Tax=Nocardioides palaemonis TaxID=2829810 RepID=UPI0035565CDD